MRPGGLGKRAKNTLGKELTFGCTYGKIDSQTFVFLSNYFERGLL
jgi:hypothetical protein